MRSPWNCHVANSLIGEDREPSRAELDHLATCDRCAAAVRRQTAFDAQLREAVGDLVVAPLLRDAAERPPLADRATGRRLVLVATGAALAMLLAVAVAVRPPTPSTAGPVSTPSDTPAISGEIDCGSLSTLECGLALQQLRLAEMLRVLDGAPASMQVESPVRVTLLTTSEATIVWTDGTVTHVSLCDGAATTCQAPTAGSPAAPSADGPDHIACPDGVSCSD